MLLRNSWNIIRTSSSSALIAAGVTFVAGFAPSGGTEVGGDVGGVGGIGEAGGMVGDLGGMRDTAVDPGETATVVGLIPGSGATGGVSGCGDGGLEIVCAGGDCGTFAGGRASGVETDGGGSDVGTAGLTTAVSPAV